MKHVNFITTLSPHKQYAMRRWFLVTMVMGIIVLMVSMFFIVPQMMTYVSLKKEVILLRAQTQHHAECCKERDVLKTEHDLMRTHTNKISRHVESPKNPYLYMTAIMQACGDGVILENMNIHKKSCDITALCPTAEHATVFTKRLSASALFTGVKLVSLQQDTQTKQLRCVVKCTLK